MIPLNTVDPTAIVHYLQVMRGSENYADVISIALLLYDYCLTFDLEVTLIWFTPWNYTKILFFITRYVPMALASILVCVQLFPNLPPGACVVLDPAAFWLTSIATNAAEIILAIRTWAVWGRNKKLGIALILLFIGSFSAECYFNNKAIKSVQITGPLYPGAAGCYFTTTANVPALFSYCFILLAIVEAVVLALMGISAFRTYRSGSRSALLNVIHKDGIMFYVYILVLTLANVFCLQLYSMDMLILPEGVLYSILTSRIMFNIRTTADREVHRMADLHTSLPSHFPILRDRTEGTSGYSNGFSNINIHQESFDMNDTKVHKS